MPPAEVRALRPTEVAAILGLDRVEVVQLRVLADDEFIDTDVEPLVMERGGAPGEQRLRAVL